MEFIGDFHKTGKIRKGINCSFIVLVAKNQCSKTLNDFRPISLSGCLYKILAKTLASRLKQVLVSIIHNTQFAFVKGFEKKWMERIWCCILTTSVSFLINGSPSNPIMLQRWFSAGRSPISIPVHYRSTGTEYATW
ncbi:uncharacterized protein LOC111279342 [Durio zibethinus]|uniref:Uncharacterized protein LOC111279342 n=1 Tax=Durio zibethinus TaxID=66656 RepID=A0A6P5X2Y4_DURZI|nr:uncharacterized protein LOC111279342 [Durio zibethinus]